MAKLKEKYWGSSTLRRIIKETNNKITIKRGIVSEEIEESSLIVLKDNKNENFEK